MSIRAGLAFSYGLLLAGVMATAAGCGSGESGETPTASIPGDGQTDGDSWRRDLPPDRYDREDAPSGVKPSTFDLHPRVTIQTSQGPVTVELDREAAPLSVHNFLSYVEQRFYDGTIFHQVFDGYILVGGGYGVDLKPKPTGPPVRNEAHNGLKNRKGTIAMRRFAGVDSATSQFLINLADNPNLDHQSRDVPEGNQPDQYGYAVFGRVVAGWETIDRIAHSRVQSRGEFNKLPSPPVVIETIRQQPRTK